MYREYSGSYSGWRGVTYEVQGLENIPADRAVLYVGNHRSYFDILVGYVTVPGLTGFVAKKEMLKIPLLRDWMHRVNCLFLDRGISRWICRILPSQCLPVWSLSLL